MNEFECPICHNVLKFTNGNYVVCDCEAILKICEIINGNKKITMFTELFYKI